MKHNTAQLLQLCSITRIVQKHSFVQRYLEPAHLPEGLEFNIAKCASSLCVFGATEKRCQVPTGPPLLIIRSIPPSSSVSKVFARNMWTLSVFASLTKRFQLDNSVQSVDRTASNGSRSSSVKSTSSAYSQSSGMPRVEYMGQT